MKTTFSFIHDTGKTEFNRSAILDVSPAFLKKLLDLAELNREEVSAEIAEYLRDSMEELSPYSDGDKLREKYNALLKVVDGIELTKREKALAKLIKKVTRDSFKGIFPDAGKNCFTDGYLMFRFADAMPNLPKANARLDSNKAIGDVSCYSVELSFPSEKELKKDIKLAKQAAQHGAQFGDYHTFGIGKLMHVYYDFGYGLPIVDAELLLTMLTLLPDCKAYAMPGSTSHPVYFVSGSDDGILLPVRKTREYKEPPVEEPVEKHIEEPVSNAPDAVSADPDVHETVKDTSDTSAENNAPNAPAVTPESTGESDGSTIEIEIVAVNPSVITAPVLPFPCCSACSAGSIGSVLLYRPDVLNTS